MTYCSLTVPCLKKNDDEKNVEMVIISDAILDNKTKYGK